MSDDSQAVQIHLLRDHDGNYTCWVGDPPDNAKLMDSTEGPGTPRTKRGWNPHTLVFEMILEGQVSGVKLALWEHA